MLLAIAFSRLGFWQLDRAQEKQAATEVFAARQLDRPLTEDDLASLMDDPQGVRFRRLRVTGRYDSAHQFLLDNRTHLGVAGYHVYTLLEISRRGPLLMVNRGWVPAGARRDVLPIIDVDPRSREISGVLELPRPDQFTLGDVGYGASVWPAVVQKLDVDAVAVRLGRAVMPVVMMLDANQTEAFLREWTPYIGITPERHRAYAFQWFALAGTLLFIAGLLWWRQRRPGEAR